MNAATKERNKSMYGNSTSSAGGSDLRYQITRFFNKDGIPVTLSILLINVVTFFLVYGIKSVPISEWLIFATPVWFHYPWTVVTWPLVTGGGPLNLVFALGWFWQFGGGLERSWGSRTYYRFVIAVAALTALTVWLGSYVAGAGMLSGLWILAGPAAVAWVAINRRETINLFFIPLPAPILAVLAAAIVWYDAGAAYGNPLIGSFALSGCAAAWWYASQGKYSSGNGGISRFFSGQGGSRTGSRPKAVNDRFRDFDREARDRNTADILTRLREQQERRKRDKKLEDMFRRSGLDDTDENGRRR